MAPLRFVPIVLMLAATVSGCDKANNSDPPGPVHSKSPVAIEGLPSPGIGPILGPVHICQSEGRGPDDSVVGEGPIVMTSRSARVYPVSGVSVDLSGACVAHYPPMASRRDVIRGLPLESGVTVALEEMVAFDVIAVKTTDVGALEEIFVEITARNGNSVTGSITDGGRGWAIAGPSPARGDFELPLAQVRRVEFAP